MPEPVKYISAKEFRDEGYLQEANRRFFHPLGLALEMTWDSSGEESDERAFISGVWDFRDDPEGIYFTLDNVDFEEAFVAKAENVQQQWINRRRPRVERLRFMVQPYSWIERMVGSDIMRMFGDALGEEMSKVIPVKASSESWQKAMLGVFDKVCERFAEEPYNPQTVSAEEVHLMDLVLGLEALTGARTRIEALNMLVDDRRALREERDTAITALQRIANGDFPPGMEPQDLAIAAIKELNVIDTEQEQ